MKRSSNRAADSNGRELHDANAEFLTQHIAEACIAADRRDES